MRINYLITGLLATVLMASCRDEYLPPVIDSDTNILVVEGVLVVNQDSMTTIRLSRSAPVSKYNNIVPENGAQIEVQGESGPVQTLSEVGNGLYQGILDLNLGEKYLVRIRTKDGKEYLSNSITARETPAIDSIGWTRTPSEVVVHANTKDPSGNTTYYRWDYEETWEIHSFYASGLIYDNGEVRDRIWPDEERLVCWKDARSTSILIGSSANLSGDRISEQPLVTIPNGSEKLLWKYSIYVRQYALDKNAYAFYDLMKKNTESIGTIFDQQPSEIRGNFKCVSDPDEPVIGFVTATTVSSQRIFINSSQVPGWVFPQNCPEEWVTKDSIVFYFEGGGYIPYEVVDDGNGGVAGYMASYAGCVDCTKRNGVRSRPSFW